MTILLTDPGRYFVIHVGLYVVQRSGGRIEIAFADLHVGLYQLSV